MKIYKIRPQFQWKRFSDSIFWVVVTIGCVLYFYISNQEGYLFYLFLLVPVVISVVIHINFYNQDRFKKVTIDFERSIITFFNKDYTCQLDFDQIKKITFYRGRKDRFIGAYTLPFSNYHFLEFKTETENFILTNLCFDEMVFDLPIPVETKIRFFNYVPVKSKLSMAL